VLKKTESRPSAKLKSIHEIEIDFMEALASTGDVRLTPRLDSCIVEIKIRIRTAQEMDPRRDTLVYERYVRALQKFVGNFFTEIDARAKSGVSLKRPENRPNHRTFSEERSVVTPSRSDKKRKRGKWSDHAEIRGFLDE